MIAIVWTLFHFFAACVCDTIVQQAGNDPIRVNGVNKVSMGYTIEFKHTMKTSKNSYQSLERLGLKPLQQGKSLFPNALLYYHPEHSSSPHWIYYQTTLQNGVDLDPKALSNFNAYMFLDDISKQLAIPVIPAAFALPKIDRNNPQSPSILQPEVPNSVPFAAGSSLSYQTLKGPRQLKRDEILTYFCRLYWLSRFMGLEEKEMEFEGWFINTDTLLPFKYNYTGAFDTIIERIKIDTEKLFLPLPDSSDTKKGSSTNLHPLLKKIFDTESDKESFSKVLHDSLEEVSNAIEKVIKPKYLRHLLSDSFSIDQYSRYINLVDIYSFKKTQDRFKSEMKNSIKYFLVERVRV